MQADKEMETQGPLPAINSQLRSGLQQEGGVRTEDERWRAVVEDRGTKVEDRGTKVEGRVKATG